MLGIFKASARLSAVVSRSYSSNAAAPNRLIITGTGKERPEALKELSRVVMDTGGNILDTRAQRLAGDIAVMMLIELPE
jgi:glycine cleavage system regulatory protein